MSRKRRAASDLPPRPAADQPLLSSFARFSAAMFIAWLFFVVHCVYRPVDLQLSALPPPVELSPSLQSLMTPTRTLPDGRVQFLEDGKWLDLSVFFGYMREEEEREAARLASGRRPPRLSTEDLNALLGFGLSGVPRASFPSLPAYSPMPLLSPLAAWEKLLGLDREHNMLTLDDAHDGFDPAEPPIEVTAPGLVEEEVSELLSRILDPSVLYPNRLLSCIGKAGSYVVAAEIVGTGTVYEQRVEFVQRFIIANDAFFVCSCMSRGAGAVAAAAVRRAALEQGSELETGIASQRPLPPLAGSLVTHDLLSAGVKTHECLHARAVREALEVRKLPLTPVPADGTFPLGPPGRPGMIQVVFRGMDCSTDAFAVGLGRSRWKCFSGACRDRPCDHVARG